VGLQDVAHRLIRDLVPQVGQGPDDAVVAPTGVLPGHLQHQLGDLLRGQRSPRLLLPPLAVVPFLCDQFPTPAEDRVRREQTADLQQDFPTQDFAFHRQAASLVVVEKDPFLPQFLLEHIDLRPLEVDDLLLLLVHPPREDHQQKLPGVEEEGHGTPMQRGEEPKLQHRLAVLVCQWTEISLPNFNGDRELQFGRVF